MGILVTLQDARALRYCKEGMKEFCEFHGISWDEAKQGIDSDVLLALNDDMATKLVEQAEKRNV